MTCFDGIFHEINHPIIGVPPWRAGNPHRRPTPWQVRGYCLDSLQGGAPQLCLLVYNPHEYYRYFTPIHQPIAVVVLMFSNLAILGPPPCIYLKVPMGTPIFRAPPRIFLHLEVVVGADDDQTPLVRLQASWKIIRASQVRCTIPVEWEFMGFLGT